MGDCDSFVVCVTLTRSKSTVKKLFVDSLPVLYLIVG